MVEITPYGTPLKNSTASEDSGPDDEHIMPAVTRERRTVRQIKGYPTGKYPPPQEQGDPKVVHPAKGTVERVNVKADKSSPMKDQ